MRTRNVVCFGGGGGHSQVLRGIRTISALKITAICPSTDSGGSTGILEKDYGIPGYLGDLTKCIAALCPDTPLAQTLLYRYNGGCLHGHSVKNVFFLGLVQTVGLTEALKSMYRICRLGSHRVIPVSHQHAELCAKLKIGNEVVGETNIDRIAQNPLWHPTYHAIQDIFLRPNIDASVETLKAIVSANWCIICPGDLYSSILPVLMPNGIQQAFSTTKAKIVIMLNIVTKGGETDNYQAVDFVNQIEKRIGRPCDIILCNDAPIPDQVAVKYVLEHKKRIYPISNDSRVRQAPLAKISEEGPLYHDPSVVAKELIKIFSE